MKHFDLICRRCGAKAVLREGEQYDGDEDYVGSIFTAVCACGVEEEIEASA